MRYLLLYFLLTLPTLGHSITEGYYEHQSEIDFINKLAAKSYNDIQKSSKTSEKIIIRVTQLIKIQERFPHELSELIDPTTSISKYKQVINSLNKNQQTKLLNKLSQICRKIRNNIESDYFFNSLIIPLEFGMMPYDDIEKPILDRLLVSIPSLVLGSPSIFSGLLFWVLTPNYDNDILDQGEQINELLK